MTAAFAFLATAVSTVFAQATLVRWSKGRQDHQRAWAISLAQFALAAAMLVVGSTTGWNQQVYRVFYLFGAVLNVPWLALGTIYLLAGVKWGKRVERVLWLLSGVAIGVMTSAPMHASLIVKDRVPNGKEVFGLFPRLLAAIGSSLGALVVLIGAVYSIVRFVRNRSDRHVGRMVAANSCIAIGTIVLGSTGALKGIAGGKDQAFAVGIAIGIGVIYAGFAVAAPRSSRRTTLPANV